MSDAPDAVDDDDEGGDNSLETKLPGIEVTTRLSDVAPEELESIHRRQIEFALERAEEAKEATRM